MAGSGAAALQAFTELVITVKVQRLCQIYWFAAKFQFLPVLVAHRLCLFAQELSTRVVFCICCEFCFFLCLHICVGDGKASEL